METLNKLSVLTVKEIGQTEEDVKLKFIVPFLECFGHERMLFEHKYKDIIIKHDKNISSLVVIEAKKYGKPLDNELEQLERYCNEEKPLLGIISNGCEIRIYSPDWKRKNSFEEKAIYTIKTTDLSYDDLGKRLKLILGKENLFSDKADDYINEREKEIRDSIKLIEEKKEQINKTIDQKKKEIIDLEEQLKDIDLKESLNYFLPVQSKINVKKVDYDNLLTNSNEYKVKKGRGDLDYLTDYIIPVVKGINNGEKRTSVLKDLAVKLNVEVSTVNERCSKKLKISIPQFDELVKTNKIADYLKQRFPERKREIDIDNELGK